MPFVGSQIAGCSVIVRELKSKRAVPVACWMPRPRVAVVVRYWLGSKRSLSWIQPSDVPVFCGRVPSMVLSVPRRSSWKENWNFSPSQP